MTKRNAIAVAIFAVSITTTSAVATGIPSVPMSVVSTTPDRQPVSSRVTPPATQQPGAVGPNVSAVQGRPSNDADEFTVESGRTQIVRVSRDHLNRIVTPFDQPTVDMIDQSTTIQIQDNVVLIATSSDAPLTLYIREHGTQDLSINLVLYPQSIPPREMRLHLGQSYQQTAGNMRRPHAQRWERSSPYTTTLVELFTDIARGDVPTGYRVSATITQTHAYLPSCDQEDLVFDFINGQMVEGHNLTVMVGTVRNVGDHANELNEARCDNWNVAGVAAWPDAFLAPGDVSEIYVAVRNNRQRLIRVQRPSLLSGGDE